MQSDISCRLSYFERDAAGSLRGKYFAIRRAGAEEDAMTTAMDGAAERLVWLRENKQQQKQIPYGNDRQNEQRRDGVVAALLCCGVRFVIPDRI
jgi:hypothetical protein